MALSETNTVKICQILNLTTYVLAEQLNLMGARLTAVVQTAIEAQILLWDTAGVKTTKLHPKESNQGVETRPDMARSDIRQKIAILLERADWSASSSGNYLPRG